MQNVDYWGHSRIDLQSSNVDWYEGEYGDNTDAEEEEEVSQAHDGST